MHRKKHMKLEGLTAIVTGGSHGIGRGIAIGLAEEGAKLVVNYSQDDEAADWTINKIRGMGREAVAVKADVGETDQCRDLVRRSNEAFGQVDILVSNAGIGQPHKIVDTPDEEWERVMNVNVRATFALTRELMAGMMQRKFGRIVTISSNCALTGTAQGSFVTYATSKGALNTLTKGIAHEGAPYITANAICPGSTVRSIAEERNEEWPPPPSDHDNDITFLGMRYLLNRKGTPEDIAATVLFLVTDSGSFITGQTIHVSGGSMMP